jgi:hypothetical protein
LTGILQFYLDDSGIRYPSRRPGKRAEHGHDWFALGGILIRSEEEEEARLLHWKFCHRWNITFPLHSSEIRSENKNFAWLRGLDGPTKVQFYEELYQFMRSAPVLGLACVVDRPGYNNRYLELYQQKPWLLCKTAFSVVVERAAKHAQRIGYRLRIAPERCNKSEDGLLRGYYDALIREGMPFAPHSSGKYGPLQSNDFGQILYDFKLKKKTSPMVQLADLYLWPICIGGYHGRNRTYARLMTDGKLMECQLAPEDWCSLASKYSCFDQVKRRP